jgi:hypothetical protein
MDIPRFCIAAQRDLIGDKNCGPVKNDGSIDLISLNQCTDNIFQASRNYQLNVIDVANEAELILARCAIFDHNSISTEINCVCPLHRQALGNGWHTQATKCQLQRPIAKHLGHVKADGQITKNVSEALYIIGKTWLPVGSGNS